MMALPAPVKNDVTCMHPSPARAATARAGIRYIGGQTCVNFSEKFTKFAKFTLCKLFGNFLINVVNLLTKM